ncbi:MAG: hypothetical protein HOY75_43465 [Streptomyces sp.]|nr:hypothetical protein [Streptomyces sp.]
MQPWVALLAVVGGIALAVTGMVLIGLLVAVGGLAWGAVMQRQLSEYRDRLKDYNAATICLAGYHLF